MRLTQCRVSFVCRVVGGGSRPYLTQVRDIANDGVKSETMHGQVKPTVDGNISGAKISGEDSSLLESLLLFLLFFSLLPLLLLLFVVLLFFLFLSLLLPFVLVVVILRLLVFFFCRIA